MPFLLITYGEQTVDSALTSILMGCAPVATIVMANTLLPEEPLSTRVLLGAACAIGGVALLVGPQALLGLGADVYGQLAIVGATLCYAITTIYVRAVVRRPALEMAAGAMIFGAATVCLATIILGKDISIPLTLPAAGAVIYLGVLSTAVANLIYFYLVPRLGATKMSQVNFAVPVGGTLIGVLVLGEALSLQRIIALVVISAAVYLVLSQRKPAPVPARQQA